jgi:hypothetical protein
MEGLETSNEQPTRNRASQVPSLYLTFRIHALETFSNKFDADIELNLGRNILILGRKTKKTSERSSSDPCIEGESK